MDTFHFLFKLFRSFTLNKAQSRKFHQIISICGSIIFDTFDCFLKILNNSIFLLAFGYFEDRPILPGYTLLDNLIKIPMYKWFGWARLINFIFPGIHPIFDQNPFINFLVLLNGFKFIDFSIPHCRNCPLSQIPRRGQRRRWGQGVVFGGGGQGFVVELGSIDVFFGGEEQFLCYGTWGQVGVLGGRAYG